MTRTDLPDHPETAARVPSALQRPAAGGHLDVPGADAARETAHHRARRQQRVTAGIAALAVVAGGLAATTWVTRDPEVQLAAGAGAPQAADVDLTWTDGPHSLTSAPTIVQDADGVLYALSTAPGTTWDGPEPPAQAIYRSTDGTTWEQVDADGAPPLATFEVGGDGLLYGLSTAPGGVVLASSVDGGTTWQTEPLPAEADIRPDVAEGIQLSSGGHQLDVVRAGETTVAAVSTQWFVEADGLVDPADEDIAYVDATDAGLEVRRIPVDRREAAPEPAGVPAADATPAPSAAPAPAVDVPVEATEEVVRTIPWSEVGLTGPADLVTRRVLTANGDEGWTAADIPVEGSVRGMAATADGIVALVQVGPTEGPTSPVRVARSTDGVAWSVDPDPVADLSYVEVVQTVGDAVVAVGHTWTEAETNATVLASHDGGVTWTSTSVADLVEVAPGRQLGVGSVGIGPLGVALATYAVEREGADPAVDTSVLFSPDGVAWDVIGLEEIDPDATELRWTAVTADRVIVDVVRADDSRATVVGIPTS